MAKSSKKLKIILLNPYLGLGGTEKIISYFFKFLKNFDTKIVIFNKKNSFFDILINKKKIIDLNVNRARYSLWKLWINLKKEKPQIIFSNQREMNIVICILNFFFNFKSTVVIREAAPIDIYLKNNFSSKIYLTILKILYKKSDGIIFNSEYTKKSFLDKGFVFKKHNIIYNPLINNSIKINFKKELKKKTFITCSRLDSQKNLFELIKIFQKYSIRNKNCKLMIVGDGNLYNNIKLEIKKIKYSKKILLLEKTHEIEKYFKLADYYISCSKSEGFGNTYLEALACNLPVISFNNGGIKSIIKKSFHGQIVNNKNYFNFISGISMVNKRKFHILYPSLKRFDKDFIFTKYLEFIISCKK